MRFPLFAVRPQLARAILGSAVEATSGRCFADELILRRRSGLPVLSQMFRSRDADFVEGWGEAWQRAHLAVVHTGTRSLVTCVEEVDAPVRLAAALEALADAALTSPSGASPSVAISPSTRWRELDTAGFRVLTVAHFFSWCFVAKAAPKRGVTAEPGAPSRAHPRMVTDARDVLSIAGLASKAPSEPHRARGPWRVYSQAEDGRVRPARGTVEPVHVAAGSEEPVIPVEVTGMVPTGGSPLVPGWGHAAVVSMTPILLSGWRTDFSGDVLAPDWSWVASGSTNLRREDLWRHDVHEHADRMRLLLPFQSASLDTRWLHHGSAGISVTQSAPATPLHEWKRLSSWSDRT